MPFLLAWAIQQIKEILLALNDIRSAIGAISQNPNPNPPGNNVQVYTGATPPAAPNDPTKGAIFTPDQITGGSWLSWDVTNQVWF